MDVLLRCIKKLWKWIFDNMKILQINTVYGKGSTGKIAKALHDLCLDRGHQCLSANRYLEGQFDDVVAISSWLDCHIHNRLARYTHMQGKYSRVRTWLFLRKVKRYSPDVIHLHNLHGSFLNLDLLFRYIKKHQIPVVWTLHDCWSFTGNCAYFDVEKCSKWKNQCCQCPHLRKNTLVDASQTMFDFKKKCFSDIENLTLVTPSQWLANLLKQSFLADYSIQVIQNGIDLKVFKPTIGDFRQKYNISKDKIVILGVSFDWGFRKGLDVFVKLSKRLDQEKYQVVLVGTNDAIDSEIPNNIISVHRTNNQNELAEIYSAADLFVNPTREDNFPTVNMESIACGTPVLTFHTGGSPEIIDETCGSVVDCDDIDAMEREIIRISETRPYSAEACLLRAMHFDMNKQFKEYVNLYERIGN